MQRATDLRAVQSLFWKLIVAPEGVRKGAEDLHRAGALESEDLSFLVRPTGSLAPEDRLDIYADMYFYRLLECLAEDFPRLAIWLGEARFHDLVTDYVLVHPPVHHSLRELGRTLPDFLAGHELETSLPGVADLARLEWARVDVFDESDAPPLSRRELLEEGAAAPDAFRMALIPAARLLRLGASALPRWKELGVGVDEGAGRHGRDLARDLSQAEACGVRVWRKVFSVLHRSVAADEEACLRELASGGATLARLGDCLVEQQPGGSAPEAVAPRLAALLAGWAGDQILSRG